MLYSIGINCTQLADIPYAETDANLEAKIDYEDNVVYTCEQGYEVHNTRGLNDETETLYGYSSTKFRVTCMATGWWSSWPLPQCLREYP